MLAAGPILALALSACSSPAEADAALGRLEPLGPEADLVEAASVLSACGPAASTPERRTRAESDLAAVRRVAEVERRAALIYPAGGRPQAQAELQAAAREVDRRADLVARLAADARAMDRIEAAMAEAAGGRWAAARPLLERALNDPAVHRLAGAAAIRALAEADRRARREASLPGQALGAARSLAELLAWFAVAVLALWLVRLASRRGGRSPPRYDIALHEGEAASQALALQLLGELRGMRTVPSVTAEPAGELGSVAVVRGPALDEQLRALSNRLDESAAISIGILKVPLRELWLGLSRVLFPPRYVWRGALTRHLDDTRFALQQRDRRTGERREWSVRAPGTDERARAEAARRMAYQIALSALPGPPPTRSVEAFGCHEAARALLDDLPEGAPRATLEEARALLERAVREDPGWEAPQLRLAGVVSRLGEVDLALEIVSGLARAAPVPRPELTYEEARICAQAGDPRRVRRALVLVERTLAAPGIPRELELSARSLRAAAAAGLLALAEGAGEVALSETERGRLQVALTDELSFFAEARPGGKDARAFSLARGLAQAARGAWLVEARRDREALAAFREVLVSQPDLLSAQLGIARAYRKAQPRGWFEQAIPWLERAERLAPGNAVAHYEHGSALLAHRPPDVDGAEAHLRKAAGQSLGALFKLGVLLAEERGQVAEGLRCLDRALEGRGARAQPHWAEKLVSVAASSRPMTPLGIDLAEKALTALDEAYQEHSQAEPGEDEDDRASRLSERRRLRWVLALASSTLNDGLSGLSDAEAGQASREVDRAGETLQRILAGFQGELEEPGLEERDRVVLERAVAELGPPGAQAPPGALEPAGAKR
jgi:tetratricopeptide (TPR) repeat protein